MKRSFIENFLLFGLILMFLWMFYTIYLRFEPFQAPVSKTDPMRIINDQKKVRVGGLLSYELDFCSFKKVPTTTTRSIEEINGSQRVYFLATTYTEGANPGCKIVPVSFPLSTDIQPGRYRVRSVGTYRVNPLQEVVKTFYSEQFEIIESTPSAK